MAQDRRDRTALDRINRKIFIGRAENAKAQNVRRRVAAARAIRAARDRPGVQGRLAGAMHAGPVGRVIPPGYKTSAERLREKMIRDQGLVKRGEVLMQKAGILPGMFSPQLRKELAMQVARDASRPDLLQAAKATEDRRDANREVERREAMSKEYTRQRGPIVNKERTRPLTKSEKFQRDWFTERIEGLQREIDKLKKSSSDNNMRMTDNGLKVRVDDRGWVVRPAGMRP